MNSGKTVGYPHINVHYSIPIYKRDENLCPAVDKISPEVIAKNSQNLKIFHLVTNSRKTVGYTHIYLHC